MTSQNPQPALSLSKGEGKNFQGARVVSFESRMSKEMSQLISRFGGDPVSAPSMKEIPLTENSEAFRFAGELLAGKLDCVIFMTGVGTRILIEALETRHPISQILDALRKTTVVVRGPKPLKVLRELEVPVAITVPEPNTWRELLQALDLSSKSPGLSGKRIALQEYGISNDALVKGLEKRGASVLRVPVYKWGLPDNAEPLERALHEIAEGKIEFALFTNAQQIRNVFEIAGRLGVEDRLRKHFQKMVVASIGPTTTEALLEYGIPVDFEPSHPKMGQLVSEASEQSKQLRAAKKEGAVKVSFPSRDREIQPGTREKVRQSVFMKACRLEKTDYTPIWLMRQAGRYMKEYRDVRAKVSFLELCKNPALAAEVAVTAQKKIGADAAILFSDILVIVEALGLGLEYSKEEGPVITGEVTNLSQVDRLPEIEPAESLSFVFDAIRATRSALDANIPLIGFAGAPFTLASYVIEGGGSKVFLDTKKLMYADSGAWHALMEKISRGLVKYLNGQIAAGADVIQIFDSWVGCLGPEDYREFVLPHTRSVISALTPGIPVIHFGTGTASFLREMREAGGQVIGVDFRIGLDEAWQKIGRDRAVQGNLDPVVLQSSIPYIRSRAKKILEQAGGRPGHIFNLGHGILPGTPVENVIALVDYVHEEVL